MSFRGNVLEQETAILLCQAANLQVENEDLNPRNRYSRLCLGDLAVDRAGLGC